MVDLAAIQGAIGSLQAAGNIAKAAIGLHDAAKLQSTVIELNTVILAAQSSAIDAKAEQSAMFDEIRSLKDQLAEMENWGAEKEHYTLKQFSTGKFSYVLIEEFDSNEYSHMLCANCFNHNQKSVLQMERRTPGRRTIYYCQRCNGEIHMGLRHYSKP